MLTAISMYYFLKTIDSRSNKTKRQNICDYTFLLLSNILLIYSHYFDFFILIVQFLFLLTNKELLLKYWKYIILAVFIIGTVYFPNILIYIKRIIDSSSNGTWVKPPSGIESLYNMLWQFSNKPVVTVVVILVFIASTIKYFIEGKYQNRTNYNVKFISFWFIFIFFFMFGISFWIPMFLDRYLMPSAIGFYILLAIAADSLIKKRYFEYIIPCLVCLLFIFTTEPNITNKRNVKETVEKINMIKTEKAAVYFCPSWFEMNFTYYYNKNCFEKYNEKVIKKNIYKCLNDENIFPIDNQNQIDFGMLEGFKKIIFLDAAADFSFPKNGILQKLEGKYQLEKKYFYNEIFNIYEFKIK